MTLIDVAKASSDSKKEVKEDLKSGRYPGPKQGSIIYGLQNYSSFVVQNKGENHRTLGGSNFLYPLKKGTRIKKFYQLFLLYF